ncbi:hypothetical protein GGH95_003515 [Coemansia sp. RSA 1836]|nr:hypothetical protein GGH95_003515 [Coemansia sp. RSA 1836]
MIHICKNLPNQAVETTKIDHGKIHVVKMVIELTLMESGRQLQKSLNKRGGVSLHNRSVYIAPSVVEI